MNHYPSDYPVTAYCASPAQPTGYIPSGADIAGGEAWLYKQVPGPDSGSEVDLEDEASLGGGGARIVCATCGAEIATAGDRIEMNGRHEHYFVNPHGIDFHVACFRAAPGCIAIGAPSAEFTWFSGYRWQLALCGACHRHLGWHFSGGGAPFFGLIADRIREAES
jgi:hypothetical protein